MRALGFVGASCLAALGLTLGACSEPIPEQLHVKVGVHNVAFDAPQGWQHIDEDTRHQFKNGLAQIFLNDSGPVSAEGFQREIERAREVYRRGELGRANDILNALRLRTSFPSVAHWKPFAESLNRARGLGTGRSRPDPDIIERAYTEILVQIAALPKRDIETLAIEALAEYEPLDRRTISAQRAMIVDERSALLIDTWDRLNHIQPMRYIFVLSGGNFLIVRTGLGTFSDIEPTYENLVATLRFQDALEAEAQTQ